MTAMMTILSWGLFAVLYLLAKDSGSEWLWMGAGACAMSGLVYTAGLATELLHKPRFELSDDSEWETYIQWSKAQRCVECGRTHDDPSELWVTEIYCGCKGARPGTVTETVNKFERDTRMKSV